LCDYGGHPLPNIYLVILAPTDTAKTGRLLTTVSGCASDTQATLAGPSDSADEYGAARGPGVPGGSGLTYSIARASETLWFDRFGNSKSINYYDNVVAYYLLWLRSGIDSYLIAARQLPIYSTSGRISTRDTMRVI